MWDLAASFPDLKTINRGFGGQMSDLPRWQAASSIAKPRIVVISCGGNANFQRLVEAVRKDSTLASSSLA
jgi:hypothetical protein